VTPELLFEYIIVVAFGIFILDMLTGIPSALVVWLLSRCR
jgi:hypothetical protein